MADLQQNTNLAHEIGLYRIALVVNAVFNQMKTQPASATLLGETENDEKACLTYFWWVILGGSKLSESESEVLRSCSWLGISSTQLKEWIAVFRQTALPIISAPCGLSFPTSTAQGDLLIGADGARANRN
jgi:hypothetical protein